MLYSIAFNDKSLKYRAYRKARRIWGTLFASINETPVFILGNQKSGTTAVALLLADATSKSVTIDLIKEIRSPQFQYLNSHPKKINDFVAKNRVDFSRDLIKEPNLTLFYPIFRERFSQAKFAMVVRDPRDNIRSILDRLHLKGTLNASVEHLQSTIPEAWYYVLDNRWFLDCGNHYIDALSARWNFIADTYLKYKRNIHLVRYEDFRLAKKSVIQNLAGALGLKVRRDVGHLVNRQFQGRGVHKKTDLRQFFSPSNLRRIESTCAERMTALGYGGNLS